MSRSRRPTYDFRIYSSYLYKSDEVVTRIQPYNEEALNWLTETMHFSVSNDGSAPFDTEWEVSVKDACEDAGFTVEMI